MLVVARDASSLIYPLNCVQQIELMQYWIHFIRAYIPRSRLLFSRICIRETLLSIKTLLVFDNTNTLPGNGFLFFHKNALYVFKLRPCNCNSQNTRFLMTRHLQAASGVGLTPLSSRSKQFSLIYRYNVHKSELNY